MDQNFSGGTHHHYYQSEQQSIPFEKRTNRVTLVFTDSEYEKLTKLAEQRAYANVGPFLRHLINIGLNTEKFINSSLGEILETLKKIVK